MVMLLEVIILVEHKMETSGYLTQQVILAVDLSVNLADAVNNYINITGVQLEVGDTATPFEHRPYDMELVEVFKILLSMECMTNQQRILQMLLYILAQMLIVLLDFLCKCRDISNIYC